ncbi:MAG: DUF2784 domain-containing protein, partial [Bacteroidota bacterium]
FLLDLGFTFAHGGLVVFNALGWIWHRTRRAHLVTLGLTFVSWFGLGLVYGLGYCPLTDWHWDVKRARGETDLPASFMKYALDGITGIDWSPPVVDVLTVGMALMALGCSIALTVRDRRTA